MVEQQAVSVSQLAERWGVSQRTIWRILSEGRLPYSRIRRGIVRIRIEDADAFLAGTSVTGMAGAGTEPDAASSAG